MSADQVTLGQLESHLWESANILRGPVDAADDCVVAGRTGFFVHKSSLKLY